MISEEVAQGMRFALSALSDARFREPVTALATRFARSDVDHRRVVTEALAHEDGEVQGLAALLSIPAFGIAEVGDFLRECDAVLPDRPDRLAILALSDASSMGIMLQLLDAGVYGPSSLCRRLEQLMVDGEQTARGWSALALGFLADDVPRAKALLTDVIIGDPSRFVVAAAMFGLVTADGVDDDVFAALRTVALTDPDGRLRGAAYFLLGLAGDDVGSAFSDVDATALMGAMNGRGMSGRSGLSADELRRVRARLRQRPVDETLSRLVVGLVPQVDELPPDLVDDLQDAIAHLPASEVDILEGLISTVVQGVKSPAVSRLATALSARAGEVRQ